MNILLLIAVANVKPFQGRPLQLSHSEIVSLSIQLIASSYIWGRPLSMPRFRDSDICGILINSPVIAQVVTRVMSLCNVLQRVWLSCTYRWRQCTSVALPELDFKAVHPIMAYK